MGVEGGQAQGGENEERKERVTRRVRMMALLLGGAVAEVSAVAVAVALGAGAPTPAASSSSDSSGAGAAASFLSPFLALRFSAHSLARRSASARFWALVFLAAGEVAAVAAWKAAAPD